MARRYQGAPIRAFVGFNGGGKTLAAMEYVVLPALKSGRPVYSTVRIDHPNAHLLQSWRELVTLSGCTVLLDEITAALPSRQAMSMPAQLARMLNQLRKVDVELAWTAPNWARADKLLREVTSYVTTCYGILPDRWLRDDRGRILRADDDGRRLRAPAHWRPNRLFRFVTYSAQEFDEFTLNTTRRMKAVNREWYWRPRHEAHRLYRTLESVELLDHLDEVGTCVVCGGSRSRPKCACPKPDPQRVSIPGPSVVQVIEPEATEAASVDWESIADAWSTADLEVAVPADDEPEPEWIRRFWGDTA